MPRRGRPASRSTFSSIASSSTARCTRRRGARSSASAASWRAIGFCNGARAAASHFPPRFGYPRPISTLAWATPSGNSRGAEWRSWVRSKATGSSTSPPWARNSKRQAASARAAVRQAVASTVAPWSVRSAAVVSAILIGDRAGLDADVERRLQEAGTYHVIAISGGNIAILAGLCIFLLRVVRAGPRSSALLVIVMLTAYAFVVEGGSSVGRATLMAAIYFAAQLCDHRTLPLNVAALTAAILFCADPLQVVDAGFALTFGATLGILVGMSKVADLLPASPWLPARLGHGGQSSRCVGVRGDRAPAGERVRVLARHVRRPHRQRGRDPVNDAGADCRDGRGRADVAVARVSRDGPVGSRISRSRGSSAAPRSSISFPWLTQTACASAAVGHGGVLRFADRHRVGDVP